MIHYSLVYMLFFCDRESARLGNLFSNGVAEKNETAFYFLIPVDYEIKENEVFCFVISLSQSH